MWGLSTRLGCWLGWRGWCGGPSQSLSLQSRPCPPQERGGGRGGARAAGGWGEAVSAVCQTQHPASRGPSRPVPPWQAEGVQPEQPSSHFLPAACPQGRFGPSCAHVCGCGQGAGCDPVTGTCACPPGRTGTHCERGESPFIAVVGASRHQPISHSAAGGAERWGPMAQSHLGLC